jgi:hypothetical protein
VKIICTHTVNTAILIALKYFPQKLKQCLIVYLNVVEVASIYGGPVTADMRLYSLLGKIEHAFGC